jgi:vacuolar-type H+-ATPase subunit H
MAIEDDIRQAEDTVKADGEKLNELRKQQAQEAKDKAQHDLDEANENLSKLG